MEAIHEAPGKGLTSIEAAERLTRFGPNDPAPLRARSGVAQLLTLFLNPLVIILLIAALASAFLGEIVNACIIVTIVLTGVAINFIQTYRSQRAIEHLRDQATPTATALRDSKWLEVLRREIVPGDVIRLSAGDLVPADAWLLQSRDLYVQQAALTGESMPMEKEAIAGEMQAEAGPDSPGMVFLGTSVVSGMATAVVLSIGSQTAFGQIAERLAMRPQETEFQRGIRQFSLLIMRAVFFLVLFIVVVSIALHHDAFQSILFAVALAVGLTPEFLPMITSITLARSALKMASRKVIVKQLSAIQNLGSIDVLCSDKTGTLTTGNMALDSAIDPLGRSSDRTFTLAWLNSHFETGIRSPLDAAILRRQPSGLEDYEKRDEIPFDFERRRLSILVGRPGTSERLLIAKGAPEGILGLSVACEIDAQVKVLDPVTLQGSHRIYEELSEKGLRVLAVAYRTISERDECAIADECELTLAGFLTFADPPRTDVAATLSDLNRDGVQVKIVTGDSDLVTRHVCEQVGLNSSQIILGDDISHMSDTALEHVVENAHVFARVSPSQKSRILLALKHRGHVVGFIGDGINDAPSLHAADVGISVSTAVDVAREAAEIILMEPGLHVLHNGIIEGRKAFGNVTKYLLMGTSSNFGNMFSMAAASLVLPFLPMLPTQILLNNFLYDLAQVTIPSDNVDEEYLARPHRLSIPLIRDFMILIGPISSIYDFLTFFVLLHFFRATQPLFHTGWFMESLATQTLVLFVIRTRRRPWGSRPSLALTFTTLAVVLAGLLLPYSPLASALGFTPLPALYFGFLAVATATYLWLVEIAKRKLFLARGA